VAKDHPLSAPPWRVLVPMCGLRSAKSRLAPLGDVVRRELALAMLLDTLTAAAASGMPLHLVTADQEVAREVVRSGLPVQLHPCRGHDLNRDLRAALRDLSPGPAAVLLGDLPALSPETLTCVLATARRHAKVVVPDDARSGTTLLAAVDKRTLQPCFGRDSLLRHVASGAAVVPADRGLRHDVDVPADLWQADELGVGVRTSLLLDRMKATRRGQAVAASAPVHW
jgi:2-phospho-L-lactate guanylyltransferase